jgi:hypothetical protein
LRRATAYLRVVSSGIVWLGLQPDLDEAAIYVFGNNLSVALPSQFFEPLGTKNPQQQKKGPGRYWKSRTSGLFGPDFKTLGSRRTSARTSDLVTKSRPATLYSFVLKGMCYRRSVSFARSPLIPTLTEARNKIPYLLIMRVAAKPLWLADVCLPSHCGSGSDIASGRKGARSGREQVR